MRLEPILKTKLDIPFNRRELINRPRINEYLNKSLNHRVTTVVAPAGYGKTTCLAQWSEMIKHSVTWLSLDLGDNNVNRFWLYLIIAIRNVDNKSGRSALNRLESDIPNIEFTIAELINDISTWKKPAILVIDDYHLITNTRINDQLIFFLNRLPKNLHIIIAARTIEHLPLSRLCIQGHVKKLEIQDLGFHHSETANFFKETTSLNLSDDKINKIVELTEGWAAGIQLIEQIIFKEADIETRLAKIDGNLSEIYDFLIEEVFNNVDKHIQDFLLQSAILDRLCGQLCDFVIDRSDSSSILQSLVKRNLFVFPLDDHFQWFRFHTLFQKTLINLLERESPEKAKKLHYLASRWFEENGYHKYAIQHAIAAGDYNRAAELFDIGSVDLFVRGEIKSIVNWLSIIPEDIIRSKPGICVAHAVSTFLNPNEDASYIIEQRLSEAEHAILTNSFYESHHSFREKIIRYIRGLRSISSRQKGDSPQSIIDTSKKALENTTVEDSIWRSTIGMNLAMAYRAIGDAFSAVKTIYEYNSHYKNPSDQPFTYVYSTYLLAQTRYIQGAVQEASDICLKVLRKFELECDNSEKKIPVLGTLYVCLGMIYLERNLLPEAEQALYHGIDRLKIMSDLDSLICGYTSLVKLKIACQADFTEINRLINELEQLGPEAAKYCIVLRINYLWSKAERDADCLSATALHVQKFAFNLEDNIPLGIDHVGQRLYEQQLSIVRFFISQHYIATKSQKQPELKMVMNFLNNRFRLAKKRELTLRIIQILILRSLAHQANTDVDAALNDLEIALSIAEKCGFFRIFIDEGTPMMRLLRKAVAMGVHQEYSTKLLKAFDESIIRVEGNTSAVEDFQLSERELQILRLITAGLSNREIGEELYIAIGTVKKHLDNIYGKLHVHKRTQAVARAQELSIL